MEVYLYVQKIFPAKNSQCGLFLNPHFSHVVDFFLPKQRWELFLSKGNPPILAFGNNVKTWAITSLKQDPIRLDFLDVNNFF